MINILEERTKGKCLYIAHYLCVLTHVPAFMFLAYFNEMNDIFQVSSLIVGAVVIVFGLSVVTGLLFMVCAYVAWFIKQEESRSSVLLLLGLFALLPSLKIFPIILVGYLVVEILGKLFP